MQHHIIDFYPPIIGLEGDFNTVRIGLAWMKRLNVGDEVYLSDNKERKVIGKAVVTDIQKGKLQEICNTHAESNHTQLNQPDMDQEDKSRNLLAIVQKFYGPQIATPTKMATVIYLRRTT
jgi:hypothetical protein